MNAITRVRIAVVGLLSAAALVGATAMVTVDHPQHKAPVADAASPSQYEHSGG
jgi:hypothetical protein